MGESGAPDSVRRSAYIGKVELMFLGQFEHTIDEKGRITFPSRFREMLADGAYVTRGFDQNLTIMTSSRWNQLYERINKMNTADPKIRALSRFIFSRAVKIEFDATGRFVIPQFLREAAHLGGSVTVLGVGENIEIWSPELWAEQNKILEDAETTTEAFSNLDLTLP